MKRCHITLFTTIECRTITADGNCTQRTPLHHTNDGICLSGRQDRTPVDGPTLSSAQEQQINPCDESYLTLCRVGRTGRIFFVVRYPRYLAYVRDAGRGRPNTSSQIRRTPDGSPTSIQRDAKSTSTTNRWIARQLLMPRSQRNILPRSSAAVDVDFGLRRRRRRPIVDVRE